MPVRKLYPLIIVLSLLVGATFLVFFNDNNSINQLNTAQNETEPTPIRPTKFTASFAIFTQGTFRVFTDSMYHNLDKNVYIQATNPNVVHVEEAGVTWDEFFATLPFTLTKDCLVTGTKQTYCTNSEEKLAFYINGVEDADALDKEIRPGDRLLVSYGAQSPQQVKDELQQIPQ